ncbi:hypothetical protein ACQKWADRAFT_278347 [Trichoderma austrokoningii]
MPLSSFLPLVQSRLSESAEILTDKEDVRLWTTRERWSNVGVQTPGMVLRPGCEDDVIQVVKAAAITSTPFAVVTGGHSPWSSIGEEGFIIDMSSFGGVEVDSSERIAKVRGGVLHKEFQMALSRQGQCTTIGDANSIGVIPYFIGGGISLYSAQFGFGSDNILSARIVTADGSLVETSDAANQDLFWAIRGAGQFFGVVTELTIRTYPLSTLGSIDGGHHFSQFVFPMSRAAEVAAVMKKLMVDSSKPTAGHLMIMARPPDFEQVIVINAHHIGEYSEAQSAFEELTGLEPIEISSRRLLFENHSDFTFSKRCPGEIKSLNLIGLSQFSTEKFLALAKLHQELIANFPDTQATQVIIGWRAPVCQLSVHDTSFGNAGQMLWLNILPCYREPSSQASIMQFIAEGAQIGRSGLTADEFITYTNCNRADPLQWRYKGAERIRKLKELKSKWDPAGSFTQEFL